MPTPFTHLQITQRLMHDPLVPVAIREFSQHYRPDFLLGGVVADQRPDGGKRADTHFYEYTQPMPDNPWREMFRQNPSLITPKSPEHKAFLTSYVAHLSADEYWSRYMLKPYFAEADWGNDVRERFYLLHLLLITMDERDEQLLPDSVSEDIRHSTPYNWLPFMSDSKICEWRDFIAQQLAEDDSQTLVIFGGRINTSPEKVRDLLDNEAYMQSKLWENVSHETLAELEAKLYAFAREQMLIYWDEFS